MKTYYYACGGYITKGKSVCQRSVIHKDAIENMLLQEVGNHLRAFLGGKKGRVLLRNMVSQVYGSEVSGAEEELSRLREQKADIERRINGILDNITETNREFADARIRELKGELRKIAPDLAQLEAASGARVDVDELTDALLGYMEDFRQVAAEGTVEEKRRFVRAFVNKVELDPATGKGRAELLSLPKQTALTDLSASAVSSFKVVAGAGFEPATFRL